MEMKMGVRQRAVARCTAVAGATLLATGAAMAVPFSYQGVVRSIAPATDVAGEWDLVCGTHTVRVTAATRLTTPVGPLTLEQFTRQSSAADPATGAPAVNARFPNAGRSPITGLLRDGFVGGVCVADGDDATRPGSFVATVVDVEIEEASVVGVISTSPEAAAGIPLAINGVAIQRLTDARMSITRQAAGFWNADGTPVLAANGTALTDQVLNDFGFGISLSESNLPPLGAVASADGYYGVLSTAATTDPTTGAVTPGVPRKIFYAHTMQVAGGVLTRTQPRPSIQRAQCRNIATAARDTVAVSGACVMPVTATTVAVTLAGVTPTGGLQTYGTVNCTYLAPEPGQPVPTGYRLGTYRFDNGGLTLAGNACPSRIRAATTQGGVTRYDFFAPDSR